VSASTPFHRVYPVSPWCLSATLERQRVLGTGPRFRKFGHRAVYDMADFVSWSNERVFDSTAQVFATTPR